MPVKDDIRMLGAFGEIGTYSFFRSHHISTMEGGMFVTSDEELYIYASSIRNHGWARNIKPNKYLQNTDTDPWSENFRFYLPGYNLRPLEISGAIGLIQLKKIARLIASRRENAKLLKEQIDNSIYHLQEQGSSGTWMAFALLIKDFKLSRRQVLQELKTIGVETRPIVSGNFLKQPVIQRLKDKIHTFGDFKNSDFVDSNGFMFANHGRSLEKELLEIVECLNNVKLS